MGTNNIGKIINSFQSFKENRYPLEEFVAQAHLLEEEMSHITFSKENGTVEIMKTKDIIDHYSELNKKCNHVADKEFDKFKKDSDAMSKIVKGYYSGKRGEAKVFLELEQLEDVKIIENISFGTKELCTEIDALVISPKCITIVEAKNVPGDITIEKNGNLTWEIKYEKDGEIRSKPRTIKLGETMKFREKYIKKYLKKVLETPLVFQSVVVFTNNKANIIENNSNLVNCTLEELNDCIEGYEGEIIYSDELMQEIKDILKKNEYIADHFVEYNAEQYKYDFAALKCKLDEAKEQLEVQCNDVVEDESLGDDNAAEKDEKTNDSINAIATCFQNALNTAHHKKIRLHVVLNSI